MGILLKSAGLAIEAITKSKIVQETSDIIDKKLDEINKTTETERITLDQLLENLSHSVDEEILATARLSNLKPLGGTISILLNDKSSIKMHLKSYFQKIDGKIILKESFKTVDNEILTESSLLKIQESVNPIVYEVNPPIGN